MPNVFLNLPTFAQNGPGTAVDVSSMGGLKTVTVAKTGAVFQPFVTIEFSCEAAPTVWTPLKTFQSGGQQSFIVACMWMRASVSNYKSGPAPNCDVASDSAGTNALNLPATAGNGTAAPVDVSALENTRTIQVGGPFRGVVNIEISADGGDYETVASFSTPKSFTSSFATQWMRVTRAGVPDVAPGLPEVNIAATMGGGGGGGIGGAGTIDTIPIWTGVTTLGDSPMAREPAESRIVVTERMAFSVDLGDVSTQHGAIVLIVTGTALTVNDGGLQIFSQQTYDSTAGPIQTLGLFVDQAATRAAGANDVVNTGLVISARLGQQNTAIHILQGSLRNDGDSLLATPITMGAGAAGVGNQLLLHCDLDIDVGQTVSLGNNVANYTMPTGRILLGATALAGSIQMTNAAGGGNACVISHYADTNLDATAFAGNRLFRGAGATVRAGVNVGSGGGQFAIGDTANALVMWSFDAGGVFGIELATGVNPDVRVRIDGQGNTILLYGFARNGTISPGALAAGITNDYNPTGFATCNRIRITTDAGGSSLGGMIPNGVDGQEIDIINLGPAGALTLIHNEATEATAARKFELAGAANRVIAIGGIVTAQYDGTTARWRVKG